MQITMVNLLPAADFSAASAICLATSSVIAFLSASWAPERTKASDAQRAVLSQIFIVLQVYSGPSGSQQLDLGRSELAVVADREVADGERSDGDADELQDFVVDRFEHPSDLSVAAFRDSDF